MDKEIIERVAEAIHLAEYTVVCPVADYERTVGFKPKVWKTDAPWDTNPDELTEHERDDYRWMAKAALETVIALQPQHWLPRPTPLDTYLLTLDDEKVEEWGIWRGDPPNPNDAWMLDRYREEKPEGMHFLARVVCTARQANAIFGVLSRLSRTS